MTDDARAGMAANVIDKAAGLFHRTLIVNGGLKGREIICTTMPQSLANVLVHIVFSTRGRAPILTREVLAQLLPYAGGVLRNIGSPLLQI